MDPQPRQPPTGLAPETDLDSTDELPVLDPKAYEASVRSRVADTWTQPTLPEREASPGTPAAAAAAEAVEDPLQTAVANLREAQELLARRGTRLAEIERSLEEARAARAGAERHVEQLAAELGEARNAAAQAAATRAAEQNEARAADEQRAARHAEELAQARAAAAQREAELGEELARARAAAGQQASELAEELNAARQAIAQREAMHAKQLAEEQLAGEVRLLAERETGTEGARRRELEHQELIAARDRAHVALQAQFDELRARDALHFESLQSAERRRALLEGLLSDLQEQLDGHESGREKLTTELAGRDLRAGQLEADLSERAARIAALESRVGSLAGTLGQRDAELTRLREAQAGFTTALEAARAATAGASARASEYETALGEARTRGATLEAQLAAERSRSAEREQELTKVRADMDEWAGALRTAQLERSGHLASMGAGEARVKQLEERVAEQVEVLRTLQKSSEAAITRKQELEADLRAAEDTITRLESQLRGRNARVSELEKANQQWRHTREESRAAHVDTATHQALREAAASAVAESADGETGGAAREPAPDGAARLLIRSENGREVVHVLSRRTTVGRTPDNDLQIDAKYISRHHALILVGPTHTIIEDLNSTNGVLVNGRRVTRQLIKDGDLVSIGRSEYRFAVRRTGEKR